MQMNTSQNVRFVIKSKYIQDCFKMYIDISDR